VVGVTAGASRPLFDRAREREISFEDIYALKLWRETEPEAPGILSSKNCG